MKKYIILLFLIIVFLLNSQDSWIYDTTMDFETFKEYFSDKSDDYANYLNLKKVQKAVIEMCKIRFEYTGKRFDCDQFSIYRNCWRKIPKNKGAFEVRYTDYCSSLKYAVVENGEVKIINDSNFKGYQIDGMFYFFREYIYPGIFDDENFLEENKNNNFTVIVWHTLSDGTHGMYPFSYVCRMELRKNKTTGNYDKILNLYRTLLNGKEIYELSLMIKE